MSSTPHAPHPERDEAGRPILFDGCPACLDHAEKRGLGLDPDRFREAWWLMVAVEFENEGGYKSDAEKQLGRALYETALTIQRFFGVDPRVLRVILDEKGEQHG